MKFITMYCIGEKGICLPIALYNVQKKMVRRIKAVFHS